MLFQRIISILILVSFFLTSLGPLPKAQADAVGGLPQPGTLVNLSPAYDPMIIKGLTVHKDNPFLFDFIVDVGQDKISGQPLKKEGEKLIKYFLAGLAIPDKDLWVNLSPYEKTRMIPEVLGQTDMGRDLLEQDYILKQITASLIYPEKKLGRIFWDKVYTQSLEKYGTTAIPINTFNKVWIMADKVEVFEHNQTAFVVGCHLKVMLEEDYLALQKHRSFNNNHSIASNIVRQIILPQLEKEINTGKNFANLRQIFNSVILSSWYKKNLKQALINQVYADKSKVHGINLNDPTIKEKIYEQYLKAYKKGVFNYIKEDIDAAGAMTPRKYFSGGTVLATQPTMITNLAMGTTLLAKNLEHNHGLVVFNTGASFTQPAQSSTPVNAAMIGRNSIATVFNFLRGKKFSGVKVKRGWKFRVIRLSNGTVDQFVAATDDARPGVRKKARKYILENREGLREPYRVYDAIFEAIHQERSDNEAKFHLNIDRNGGLKELYWELLNDTKIEDLVWPIFIKAWKNYQSTRQLPQIKYRGLRFKSRSKEIVELLPVRAVSTQEYNAAMRADILTGEGNLIDDYKTIGGGIFRIADTDIFAGDVRKIEYWKDGRWVTEYEQQEADFESAKRALNLAIGTRYKKKITFVNVPRDSVAMAKADLREAVREISKLSLSDVEERYRQINRIYKNLKLEPIEGIPTAFEDRRWGIRCWDTSKMMFFHVDRMMGTVLRATNLRELGNLLVTEILNNGKEQGSHRLVVGGSQSEMGAYLELISDMVQMYLSALEKRLPSQNAAEKAMKTGIRSVHLVRRVFNAGIMPYAKHIFPLMTASVIAFGTGHRLGVDHPDQRQRVLDGLLPNQLRLSRPSGVNPGIHHSPQTNADLITRNGGIDLNTTNGTQWKDSKVQGVEMKVDPAMIARFRQGADELSLVVFKITPVSSIWALVGLKEPGTGFPLSRE